MSADTFTSVEHPQDPTYQLKRQRMIRELLELNTNQLNAQLKYQQQAPLRDDNGVNNRIINDLLTANYIPQAIKSGILDSSTTSGNATTGGYLIRQDLEPTLYA